MSTETIGGGLTATELSQALASGHYKPIKRTKKQQREHDEWVASIKAARAAERVIEVEDATRTRMGRLFHWLFQTSIWKEYKAKP